MAKVIVFHYTDKGRPGKLSEDELDELMSRFYDKLKNYPDVRFNGTFVDEQGRGICDWDAPNAEVVKEIIEKVTGEPPVDGAVAVKRTLWGHRAQKNQREYENNSVLLLNIQH